MKQVARFLPGTAVLGANTARHPPSFPSFGGQAATGKWVTERIIVRGIGAYGNTHVEKNQHDRRVHVAVTPLSTKKGNRAEATTTLACS